MEILQTNFSVVDVETTGLSHRSGERICEIGIIRLVGQKEVGRLHLLIDPQRPISKEAFEKNKITPEMLRGAPRFEEIAPSLYSFIHRSIFVAQKAYFDLDFINSEFSRCGYPAWQGEIIDTISIARYLFPGRDHYDLDSLLEIFDIKATQRHRSMGDVEATAQVFIKSLGILSSRGCRKLSELLQIGKPVRF